MSRLASLAIVAFLFCGALAHGADDQNAQAAAESQQYLAEEKADLERTGDPDLAYSERTGKLVAFTADEIQAAGDPTIFGTFQCDGQTHFVRTLSDSVKTKLAKYNGKTLTVNSKLRNNGKYIYVKSIVLSGPGDDGTARPGGL